MRLFDPRPHRSVMSASLIAQDGERYLFPVLDHARLLTIRGSGILLTGDEVIPISRGSKNIRSERFRQTWWCVPVAPGGDVIRRELLGG